jgi:hypothetical protein
MLSSWGSNYSECGTEDNEAENCIKAARAREGMEGRNLKTAWYSILARLLGPQKKTITAVNITGESPCDRRTATGST